jgi:hypothetical protein
MQFCSVGNREQKGKGKVTDRVVTDHFFSIAIPVAFKNKKRNAVAIAIAILPKDRGRGRDLFCDRH